MYNKTSMDEQQLIKELKQQRASAFKTVVTTYQDQVLNTCYRFLFNREDAEDVAQEVFLEIHRSAPTFRGDSKLSTWIYRVAVSKSLNYLRHKKRKKRFAPVKSLMGLEEEGKQLPDPDAHAPDHSLESMERMTVLQNAIAKLPENQKVAFTLSKCEGFGNKEIANIMGTSLSSVDSLIHRAKKKLRDRLYSYFEKDLKKTGNGPTSSPTPVPTSKGIGDALREAAKINADRKDKFFLVQLFYDIIYDIRKIKKVFRYFSARYFYT